jgi:hypothetical protein
LRHAGGEIGVVITFASRTVTAANQEDVAQFFTAHQIDQGIGWDNRTVYQYLQKHGLKYHPLWDQGYLSVGDTHTTRKWEPGMAEEETRFFGLKRECGLHEG